MLDAARTTPGKSSALVRGARKNGGRAIIIIRMRGLDFSRSRARLITPRAARMKRTRANCFARFVFFFLFFFRGPFVSWSMSWALLFFFHYWLLLFMRARFFVVVWDALEPFFLLFLGCAFFSALLGVWGGCWFASDLAVSEVELWWVRFFLRGDCRAEGTIFFYIWIFWWFKQGGFSILYRIYS